MTFTAGLDDAVFLSHKCKLIGGLYRGAGESPRPTAVLLHGVPGVEKNLDLAYALREAGWNCLYFHYRGSWGSEGSYSFHGLADDVHAAARWVVQHPAVDGGRLALVGNSMGGYLTLAAGAADARFKALAPICPLVDPATVSLPLETFNDFAAMLHGVTGEELRAQWSALPPVQSMAAQLAGRPILLVTGDLDEVFPPDHYRPLVASLPDLNWEQFAFADHSFSLCRRELVECVVGWLIAELGQ